jgi:uncharacterized repeat protein (TIGR01451 family)
VCVSSPKIGHGTQSVPAAFKGHPEVIRQSCHSHGSIGRFPLAWLVVALAGCMTLSPQPRMAGWRAPDSPAPLGAADEYEARRPVPPATTKAKPPTPTAEGALPLPRTGEAADEDGELDAPPEVVRSPPDLPQDSFPKIGALPTIETIPRIEPEDVTAARPLELTVAAPSRRAPGGTATYRVTLRNTGDRPQEGLIVHCRFDDALVFAGSDRREVVQRVDRLPVGESKELALSLTSDEIGAHCCRFVVTRNDGGNEVELAFRQVCVEFVTRHVEIEIVGPAQRTEGSRAEFNITLSNNSLKKVNDAQVAVSFDKALVPREVSAEAERKSGMLVWRLGALQPLEKVELQVEFECRTQAHRACVFVDVKGANLSGEHEEASLEIVPVPGTLDLRVSDRDDPLQTGKTGAYEVIVQNIGLQAARRVVVEAALPENVKFLSATVRSGDATRDLKFAVDERKVVFDPVDLLEPNGRLVYTIEVEALRAGPAEFRASLTNSLGSTAVTASEPTTIVEP